MRTTGRPQNYDGSSGDTLTLRSALENSRNLATVHLLDGGIEKKPEASLDRLCELAIEAQIYRECLRYYPFVLGAQPVRPIDLAAFYASIANEGMRPAPYLVESIERDGESIYRRETPPPVTINSVDPAAFYQLKTMLQGVLARGTARSIAGLAPYVAGKTGTSDDENDAWFVGFTNDVTVAVWLGYDNATGKRRTLGGGSTGGNIAVPIFEPIMQAVWANVAPKTALAPPTPQAELQLTCKSTGSQSRNTRRSGKAITECFRVDAKGRVVNTQYRLVAREGAYAKRERAEPRRAEPGRAARTARSDESNVAPARDPWRGGWGWGGWEWRSPQRADPGQFWGGHRTW